MAKVCRQWRPALEGVFAVGRGVAEVMGSYRPSMAALRRGDLVGVRPAPRMGPRPCALMDHGILAV